MKLPRKMLKNRQLLSRRISIEMIWLRSPRWKNNEKKPKKKTLWVFIIHFTWSFYQAWTFFSEEWCFCNYVDLMPPSDCRFNRSIKTFHIITQNLNISLLHSIRERKEKKKIYLASFLKKIDTKQTKVLQSRADILHALLITITPVSLHYKYTYTKTIMKSYQGRHIL